MKALKVLLLVIIGYVAGAFLGGMAVEYLSSNRHDRSVEAAMTGAFVTGPLGAVAGLVLALLLRRRGRSPEV